MINFKFVKSQLKSIKTPLIIFSILLFTFLIPAFFYSYLAPYSMIEKTGGSSSTGSKGGAAQVLEYFYFGVPGSVLYIALSIILIHRLFSREVEKGYFGSWLTTPMSRRTILNSKLFTILSSIFVIQIAFIIIQFLFLGILTKDLMSDHIGSLLLFNFAFMILILFWISINWVIIIYFNKSTTGISIAVAILGFFSICSGIALLSVLPGFEQLKYLKYFSIQSLLNSPFHFDKPPRDVELPPEFIGVVTGKILSGPKAIDYAWQIPVMLVTTIGFYVLGEWIICRKDFFL
ncbi:ABC transporter permease subunit [Spiroplasma chrysopicola]|uniref:Uncharacterized protein n=1 Tax=Spiroplasma chrysopicola DF-1 TaxID=1276227 RepID=R4UIW5_9MOLU|nr:ABC transporter permease subunit [Spiroplasma chrysopicola]AGM25251.1 hypothetical protein SCHRY_v1c06750 [Spiroplasma chrysopicola DF-1]